MLAFPSRRKYAEVLKRIENASSSAFAMCVAMLHADPAGSSLHLGVPAEAIRGAQNAVTALHAAMGAVQSRVDSSLYAQISNLRTYLLMACESASTGANRDLVRQRLQRAKESYEVLARSLRFLRKS
jgi:hypothetical protein